MPEALSLDAQERLLRYRFPRADVWYAAPNGRRHLCFRLRLRPTPTSDTYTVMFAYAVGGRPLVWVEDPKPVTEAHGQPTPHLNGDGTLCLYDGTKGEWSASDILVYTTVPWTQRWLYHYEHWLAFGEWRGDAPTESLSSKPQEQAQVNHTEVQ